MGEHNWLTIMGLTMLLGIRGPKKLLLLLLDVREQRAVNSSNREDMGKGQQLIIGWPFVCEKMGI